ncbi:uncharacterized protein LOC143217675 [Lasioglossum baleicum]|uniref:uncharacterized protein LOC143217675 n=1 Tax=Lasioglossum baleicum TaxID=434251 RepID=UPI003FCE2DB8
MVLRKLRPRAPPVAETMEPEFLGRVVDTLFPPNNNGGEGSGERAPVPANDWSDKLRVSDWELDQAIQERRARGKKAPGPDGVPGGIMASALKALAPAYRSILDACLSRGVFPKCWKEAILVLLHKDVWVPEGALNDRCVGASASPPGKCRRSGQGVDRRVIGHLQCVQTLTWKEIEDALEHFRVPLYLREVLRDYLREREVYIAGRYGAYLREICRGVPQGSILGPLLWILAFDAVLRDSLPSGTGVICYADDTLPYPEGRTWEETGRLIESALDCVVGRIRKDGACRGRRKDRGHMVVPTMSDAAAAPRIPDPGRGYPRRGQAHHEVSGPNHQRSLAFRRPFRSPGPPTRKDSDRAFAVAAQYRGAAVECTPPVHRSDAEHCPVWGTRVAPLARGQPTQCRALGKSAPSAVPADYTGIPHRLDRGGGPPGRGSSLPFGGGGAGDRIPDRLRIPPPPPWEGADGRGGGAVRSAEMPGPCGSVRAMETHAFILDASDSSGPPAHVLTGHGCFGEYLVRMRREPAAQCHHCGEEVDTAQHTLEECPAWAGPRRVLRAEVEGVDMPWTVVAADIMGPFPPSRSGNSYLLVIQDLFTKWIECTPLRQRDHRDWDLNLPQYRFAYNTAHHSVLQASRAFLNFGREPRPAKYARANVEPPIDLEVTSNNTWKKRVSQLPTLRHWMLENLEDAYRKQPHH